MSTIRDIEFNDRFNYIIKKMHSKEHLLLSPKYIDTIKNFIVNNKIQYNENCDFCGRPNGISKYLVPDFKSKKVSCYIHDRLYEFCELNKMTKWIADNIFYYSMLYDAGFNFFKRATAYIYYKAVKDFVEDLE